MVALKKRKIRDLDRNKTLSTAYDVEELYTEKIHPFCSRINDDDALRTESAFHVRASAYVIWSHWPKFAALSRQEISILSILNVKIQR